MALYRGAAATCGTRKQSAHVKLSPTQNLPLVCSRTFSTAEIKNCYMQLKFRES